MAYEVSKAPTPTPAQTTPHALNIMGYIHAIRRRKSLMFLGLVVGLGLGALYYSRIPPVFESNTKMLITMKTPDVLGPSDRGFSMMLEDQVANQISMIRSPLIARAAAEVELNVRDANGNNVLDEDGEEVMMPLSRFPFYQGRDPATLVWSILGGLNATRGDQRSGESASVVSLSYRSGDPTECGYVLEAVIKAHDSVMEKSYGDKGIETYKLISKAKDELSKQLDETYKKYSELKLRNLTYNNKNSLMGAGKQSPNEKSAFQAKMEALLVRNAEITTHLKAFNKVEEATPKKPSSTLLAMAERFALASGPVVSEAPVSETLIALMAQEQEMAATFGPDYTPLQRLRAKLTLLKSVLPSQRLAHIHDDKEDPVERHKRELSEELASNNTMREAYGELINKQTEQLEKSLEAELAYEKAQGDFNNTKSLYEATVQKVTLIDLTKGMSGVNTLVLSPPGGGRKVAPILSTCLSISSFFGIIIGLGLVYLAEMTDRSFKGPDDVVHRLGAPVIAHMPAIDYQKLATAADVDSGTSLSPVLCVYHRPKSRDAEAIRGIRTAIFFGNQASTLKLIQFTSAQAGDGKSTLACNVALSIAQSGKRVIIVEADLRRPSFGAVFGKMPEVGFAQVLAGSDRWQDALLTFPEVPNLAVLPCGERPHNPAELLTGPLLAETLDQMKEVYDYVIVDTPPLLPVTDPCSVAARADGVILVVQMGRNTRPNAERASSLLETLGVRLLGIVMNRMTKDGGYGYGYGYGTYGYNYGSGYKYGGYGYRSETGYYARGDAYYEEEHRNGVDGSSAAK